MKVIIDCVPSYWSTDISKNSVHKAEAVGEYTYIS